ncbi:MAG: hypothetical protein RSG55_03715 [Oscillospiraceae bacterium]
MSFPNIPDINPYIGITFDDAINLLLTSIAMEEISLSKLMDAETSKILCVLETCGRQSCGQSNCLLGGALEINKSVDETIKDIIKLQMLLQFKLKDIKEILPPADRPCCPPPKKECGFSLIGKGKGCVCNPRDPLHNHSAALYAFISSKDCQNRTIRYSVGDEDNLRMSACGSGISARCPKDGDDRLMVSGKGFAQAFSKCGGDVSAAVDFVLTVWSTAGGNLQFRMEISSAASPKLNHDSGRVSVKSGCSDLCLSLCC